MKTEKSEFGRGLAVCLLKFMEHFSSPALARASDLTYFKNELRCDVRMLDSTGADIKNSVEYFHMYNIADSNLDEFISSQIETWANATADHLYEIQVPAKWKNAEIGVLVKKLQNSGLRMGHGFSGRIYTLDDVKNLKTIALKVAVLLDKKIGILSAEVGKC